MEPNCIVITGPTASGKGAVAFEVARRAGGEIISLDSMKVYREMNVSTAKPPVERRAQVSYHLMDIVDPDVDFSVGDYLPLLDRALKEIAARGAMAVITGGTALYLKGYLDGFHAGQAADWTLRKKLLEEAKAIGPRGLHERLGKLDPASARKIHPMDLRRTVRAIEVLEKTGRPLSEEWAWGKCSPALRGVTVFGLERERAELYARIERRVEAMVARGLFEESKRLMERKPPLSRSASQSIGYKEIVEGLSAGLSEEEIVSRIKQSTRQFAKRQLTWFRKLPIRWIQVMGEEAPEALAEGILLRNAQS